MKNKAIYASILTLILILSSISVLGYHLNNRDFSSVSSEFKESTRLNVRESEQARSHREFDDDFFGDDEYEESTSFRRSRSISFDRHIESRFSRTDFRGHGPRYNNHYGIGYNQPYGFHEYGVRPFGYSYRFPR